jgi:predicted dehydrogenase
VANKVKYAIVGCGSVSWNRYFKEGNFQEVAAAGGELAAVCDVDEARARRPAEKFGVPYFTSQDEMQDKIDFDLLVNLTHVPAHFEASLKGLRGNRHVYTQKPMTVTVEEATCLIEEARGRNLKLVAEDAGLLQPVNRTIIDLVHQGAIGKVTWLRSRCTHWGPAIIDNWPTDPAWFYQKGAGPLRDVGVERLHMITAILGPAKRVTAMSGVNQPEIVVRGGPNKGKVIHPTEDDVTLMIIDFGDGIYAMLDSAWVNVRASLMPLMEIYGQKGVLTHVSGGGNKGQAYEFELQLYRDEPELGIRGWTDVNIIPPAKPDPNPSIVGLVHAVESIQEDKAPILSGERARHCIEIIEKAFLAARTGVTQNLETSF